MICLGLVFAILPFVGLIYFPTGGRYIDGEFHNTYTLMNVFDLFNWATFTVNAVQYLFILAIPTLLLIVCSLAVAFYPHKILGIIVSSLATLSGICALILSWAVSDISIFFVVYIVLSLGIAGLVYSILLAPNSSFDKKKTELSTKFKIYKILTGVVLATAFSVLFIWGWLRLEVSMMCLGWNCYPSISGGETLFLILLATFLSVLVTRDLPIRPRKAKH